MSATAAGRRDLVLERLLTAWTREDPAAAARFAELRVDSFLREVAMRTVAQLWARVDRDAAASWAGSLGDAADRAVATGAVALATADSDPRAALDMVDDADGTTRQGVITRWAARDAAGAASWLMSQPPSAGRDDVAARVVFLLAQSDARAAVALADQLLTGTARNDAYASIVGPWMARDPDGARAWIDALDERARRRLDAELAIAGSDAAG